MGSVVTEKETQGKVSGKKKERAFQTSLQKKSGGKAIASKNSYNERKRIKQKSSRARGEFYAPAKKWGRERIDQQTQCSKQGRAFNVRGCLS